MLIDCHQHTNVGGKNSDAVVADLDRAGIDKAWLLTWEVPEGEYDAYYVPIWDSRHGAGLPLDDVVRACERHPTRFIAGYAPDPRRPDAIERLQSAVEMHGVRVFGELKVRICLDDPDVVRVFHACGVLNVPVIVHIDVPARERPKLPARDYWYCVDIDRLETVLRECPETTFIGHAPGFWRHISGDGYEATVAYPDGPATPGGRIQALMKKHPNLYGDLSARSALNAISRPPAGHGRRFLVEFQDRLLFARDGTDDNLVNYLKSLDQPREAWEKITHLNAERLVPLT